MSRALRAVLVAAFLLIPTATAQAAPVVVSEFRFRGPNGAADEYIELRNTSSSPQAIGGWLVQGCNSGGTISTRATIDDGVTLPPGGSYLLTNSSASGGPYSGSVPGDQTFTTGITDTGGVRLVSAVPPAPAPATVEDAVGSSAVVGTARCREGNGLTDLPAAARADGLYSYERRAGGTQDTDDNAADFEGPKAADPQNGRSGDDAPSVSGASPANGAANVATDTSIRVTFSEPVTIDPAGFSLTCGGQARAVQASQDSPTSAVVEPSAELPRGESCTLRIDAAAVRDVDGDDPPDTMTSDATVSFTTVGLELRIREIQGTAHISPHLNDAVSNVPGVVTARRTNGFFMQDPQPDADDRTSEGLFVFTSSAPAAAIAVGRAVEVSGRVTEFRGAANALGMTQISGPSVMVLGDGAAIPATVIGEGGRVPPDRVIDNDSLGDVDVNPMFDPDEDGIDFYETLEGMKVQVNEPHVVGPTASFGEIPVVGDGGRFAGPFTARGGLLAVPGDFNPERIHLDDEVLRAQSQSMPAADVRDRLSTVQGVVDYSFGNFKVQVLAAPTVTDGGLEKEVTEAPDDGELSVGSFNVENLTPLGANPSAAQRAKYAALAETLVTRMKAPDIVAVEEVQDNNGTSGGTGSPVVDASQTWADLIAAVRAAGGPSYDYRQIDPVAHQDGGAPGGNIRVGFLFRTDRGLQFVDRPGGTATNATGVVDTRHGPQLTLSPGRIQPADAAWIASRKPLAGEFMWRGRTVFAVANHFASKGGDDPLFGHRQPPVRHTENGPDGRHRQATLVNEFTRQLLAADKQARVIVLGDINDFDFSRTVEILESGGALTGLFRLLPRNERYSYVFEGNSQVLDQILVSPSLLHPSPEYDSVHMNAEFADQSSDHDPQVGRFHVTGRRDAANAG